MVGRTSKRNRRDRIDPGQRCIPPGQTFAVTTNTFVNGSLATQAFNVSNSHSPEASILPSSSGAFAPDLMNFLLKPNDFNENQFVEGFEPNLLSSGSGTSPGQNGASPRINLQQPNTNLDIDRFPLPTLDQNALSSSVACFSQSTSPPNMSCPQTPLPVASHTLPQDITVSNQDGQRSQHPHISALCKIIQLLETYLEATPAAIDEVMRINKACMADITKIMSMEEHTSCRSCGMLISAALDLIILLYENAISPEVANPQSRDSHFPAQPRSSGYLQFGVFQLDPDEQVALSNQIICKELQRGIQIIRASSAERQSSASSYGRVRKQWHIDMEQRAGTLLSSLGGLDPSNIEG